MIRIQWIIAAVACATSAALPAAAQSAADHPFLSPLFSDNMVLQRGMKDPVWGWTTPGSTVTVTLQGRRTTVTASPDGRWEARVGPLPVGGPYAMSVAGPETVTISNILVGDVWICSGQSNMEFGIGNGNNAAQEIANANHPNIRLFSVQHSISAEPHTTVAVSTSDLRGVWSECTPQTVRTGGWNGFSAVAYFFGRKLHTDLHVPIGLIHTSWGGTVAEAWTSAQALATMPDFAPALSSVPARAQDGNNPNVPTVLYNGMIAPLIPFAIKGAIWYQGESNVGRGEQYHRLLPTMIRDWRSRWGEGDFPFLIVQLANFLQTKPEPADDPWAELREAQLQTAETLPKTGLAVIIDIGDANDIHPKDKQDVGDRLALAAEAIGYGKRLEYSGPIYRAMTVNGSSVRLTFDHTAGGLVAKGGGKLEGFAIAGEDRHFVWADARIEGNSIVVSSPEVPHPVAVRYAWAANPVCNLYNGAGLPASPFRTDERPGVTASAK